MAEATEGTTTTDTGAKDDTSTQTDATTTSTTPAVDHAADAAKWKALARKHEAESKSNSEAAKKLAAIEEAGKTELERAQKAAADADTRIKAAEDRAAQATIKSAVIAAATKAGAVDPAVVFALLDTSSLTVGDDDEVEGVDAAVKALLADKAYLVGKTRPAAGSGDQGVRGDKPVTVTREQLKTMSPNEIRRLPKAAVDAALAAPY